MFFLFTQPWLLAALAGLGIPVMIHLLLKQKSPRLRFSTVRFFQKQEPQASAKRRLRNLLLLLVRLLVFALLVLAFARPYLPWAAGATPPARRQQVILVLDRSASLQADDGRGIRWAQAKKVARDLLASLRDEDRAAVITSGSRAVVATGLGLPSVAVRVLEDVTPGAGSGDLAAGVREALRVAATADAKDLISIAVISDFQRTGALNLAGVAVPAGIEVKVLPTGDLASPNLAVTELQLTRSEDLVPQVTVMHHGDEAIRAMPLQFEVDNQPQPPLALTLAPGDSTNLPIVLPALKPGWHAAEVRLAGRDALPLDDVRYAAFFVPEPIRVLLVEGRTGVRSFEEQTFFVGAALDPDFETTNTSRSRFSLQKCRAKELARALVGTPASTRPEIVILPAQRSLGLEAIRALTEFVRAGGGLLLWVGDDVVPGGFNLDFAELSPAVLRTVESTDEAPGWHLGEHAKDAPIFASFRRVDAGNLSLPGFMRRFSLAPGSGTGVHARFEDGVPLLLGREVGRGRTLLVNTSVDTAWTDWPKRKSFVPWLHDTVAYLAGRNASNVVHRPGDDLDLGVLAAKGVFQLTGPSSKPISVTADGQGRLALELETPGIYRLRDSLGRDVRWLAVNIPAAESDLAALRSTEFQQQLGRSGGADRAPASAGLFDSSRNQREFWRVLLWSALVLLVAETIFANRSFA